VADEVLAACLGPDDERLGTALAAVTDWSDLVERSLCQGIHVLLLRRLETLGGDRVASQTVAALRDLHRDSDRRASRLVAQLLKILDLFAGRGIVAVPFKGPALAQDLYGDLSTRRFDDLDILVAPQDVLRARDLLLANGFARVQPRREVPEGVLLRNEGELAVQRGERDPLVELHWRVGWRLAAVSIPAEEIIACAWPLDLLGREVFAPSIGDQVLILCTHGASHAWHELEMMAAVVTAARRVAARDWPALLHRARRFACLRRVLVGLVLSHETAAAVLPHEVRLRAAADPAVRRLVDEVRDVWRDAGRPPSSGERLRRIAWLARTEDSRRAAAAHLTARTLTPGPEDWDSLALPASLSGLYYLWRPLRLVGKFARRTASAD